MGCIQCVEGHYVAPKLVSTHKFGPSILRIYPNPASDVLHLNAPNHTQWQLYSPKGEAVVEGANGSGNIDSINKICCGSFKLSKSQKEKLVAAHKAKEECMDANRKILKNIDAEIKTWAKTQKENIIANTKLQMDSINKLYAAGTITAAQQKEMLHKLELTRAELLKGLAAKAKDKIKNNIARATASGKIKDCEKTYLKSIKEILTAEQFEKWVKCFKEKYKKK